MRRRARLALPALLALLVAVHHPMPAARASSPASAASEPMQAPPPPTSPVAPAAPPSISRPDAVARVVMSLLSYARWPGERETVRLCIDNSARFAGKLMEGGTLPTGRLVETRRVDALPESLASECDALYLGAMTDTRRRALTAFFIGKPVLVMTEEDFECEGGSMFCLSIREHQVSFRINLDAIARSGIHVHPGVLQLGRRKAPAS